MCLPYFLCYPWIGDSCAGIFDFQNRTPTGYLLGIGYGIVIHNTDNGTVKLLVVVYKNTVHTLLPVMIPSLILLSFPGSVI